MTTHKSGARVAITRVLASQWFVSVLAVLIAFVIRLTGEQRRERQRQDKLLPMQAQDAAAAAADVDV